MENILSMRQMSTALELKLFAQNSSLNPYIIYTVLEKIL